MSDENEQNLKNLNKIFETVKNKMSRKKRAKLAYNDPHKINEVVKNLEQAEQTLTDLANRTNSYNTEE